jgi:hypothetical protein
VRPRRYDVNAEQRKPRPTKGNRSGEGPDLSPELDLLEYLSYDDQPLDQAKLPFDSLAHAKRAVTALVACGAAQLVDKSAEGEPTLKAWRVQEVLQDDQSWCLPAASQYVLRLTSRGRRQFIEDSASFFDRLFREPRG